MALSKPSSVSLEREELDDIKEKQNDTLPIKKVDNTLSELIAYRHAKLLHKHVNKIIDKIEKDIEESDKIVKPVLLLLLIVIMNRL